MVFMVCSSSRSADRGGAAQLTPWWMPRLCSGQETRLVSSDRESLNCVDMTNNLPQLASWTPKEHQSPSDLPIELQAAILDLKEFAIDFAARSSERRKQNEVPKLLYQYTDLNALMSIHQNREVWVSDAGFMNDPLEGTWIHRAAVEATDRHFIDSPVYPSCKKMISFMASDDAATSFVSTDQLNGDLAELYIRSEFGRAYIGSFTANGDLLSQWRGYGDGGAGVSIGLDLQPYALAYAGHDGDFLSVKLLQVVDVTPVSHPAITRVLC